MNIYVGNISYGVTEDDLRQVFGEFGVVLKASIVIDRETGRSRGFAFVEMEGQEAGEKAISALNGTEWNGRVLAINEARPREARTGGFTGGGDRRPSSSGSAGGDRRPASGGGGYSSGSGGGGGGYSGGGNSGGSAHGRRTDGRRREDEGRDRGGARRGGLERRGRDEQGEDWRRRTDDDDDE